MNDAKSPIAWLEKSDGESITLQADCPIGRMPDNKIALPDEKVSRYHAMIQHREHEEFWLVDLGSSNGTYHNHRRIRAPMLLHNGDHIQVGDHGLVFHQIVESAAEEWENKTIHEVKSVNTWLLVADIEGSSRLQQSLPLDEARKVIHAWMSKARGVVEKNNGVVNQFLGDGVFAYWADEGEAHTNVASALADLGALRQVDQLGFRLALHYGSVMTGGTVLGEENLHGPNVHFVFRMEQLGKQLKEFCLLSETATGKLSGAVRTIPLGRYILPGFTDETLFHRYAGDAGVPPEPG